MTTLASLAIRTRFLMLATLLCVALAGCSSDDNPTAPGGGDDADWVTMTAAHDTYIDAAHENQNYGQNGLLRVGPGMDAFLQFDLTSLSPDAVITGARVRLTQTGDDEATGAASVDVVWTAADDWDEDTVTAAEAPAMGSESLGSIAVDALASGQRSITFEAPLAREKTGSEQLYLNRVMTLRLSSSQRADFLSGEHGDGSLRPSLQVTYTDGTRITLPVIEDAWTTNNAPDQNMSDSAYVVVNRSYERTFVKLDLSALPDDARIEMARFKMMAFDGYAYGGDGRVYSHLIADDSWSADTITANNEPAVAADHCGYWWLWYDHTDREAWGVNQSLLLAPVVKAESVGDDVLSLRLHSPGYTTKYYRIDHEDAAKQPALEIVYTR